MRVESLIIKKKLSAHTRECRMLASHLDNRFLQKAAEDSSGERKVTKTLAKAMQVGFALHR